VVTCLVVSVTLYEWMARLGDTIPGLVSSSSDRANLCLSPDSDRELEAALDDLEDLFEMTWTAGCSSSSSSSSSGSVSLNSSPLVLLVPPDRACPSFFS